LRRALWVLQWAREPPIFEPFDCDRKSAVFPKVSAVLAEINARELGVKEQFKKGRLAEAVFKTWLAVLAKEREVLNRPTTSKPARISRSEFRQECKSAVASRLKVFTNRETIALCAMLCATSW
jgi:hypothetical protein